MELNLILLTFVILAVRGCLAVDRIDFPLLMPDVQPLQVCSDSHCVTFFIQIHMFVSITERHVFLYLFQIAPARTRVHR